MNARRSARLAPLAVLIAGVGLAVYLGGRAPKAQHVRLVLGAGAPKVTAVAVQYVAPDGDIARESRLTFEPGKAPRVVALEPELADGEYRLRIDLDLREGRRSSERSVTLGGGTTSVDLAGVISDERTKP